MKNNDNMVGVWQHRISVECERILQRQLADNETSFVRGREGFTALEMIEDSVSHMNAVEPVTYLNIDHDR